MNDLESFKKFEIIYVHDTTSLERYIMLYMISATIIAKSASDDTAFEVFATDLKPSQFRKINKIIKTTRLLFINGLITPELASINYTLAYREIHLINLIH